MPRVEPEGSCGWHPCFESLQSTGAGREPSLYAWHPANRLRLDGLSYNEAVSDDLTIIFEPCEEGGYTATIPEVPGAVSEGETVEEAREMVLDALRELTAYRRKAALDGASTNSIVQHARLAA